MLGLGNGIPSSGDVIGGFSNNFSILFDGTDDYIDLPVAVERTGGSISIWFKTDNVGNQVLFGWGKDGSTTDYGQIILGNNFTSGSTTEIVGVTIRSNNSAKLNCRYDNSTATTLRDDAWHHLVWTMGATASGGNKMYIDGSVLIVGSDENDKLTYTVGNAATGAFFLTTNTFDIVGLGRRFYSGSALPYDGNIDDVGIWSSVLDAAAVTAIYNSGVPFDLREDLGDYDVSDDLVNYWRFEENTGTTAEDLGSGGNDGTLTSGAAYEFETP